MEKIYIYTISRYDSCSNKDNNPCRFLSSESNLETRLKTLFLEGRFLKSEKYVIEKQELKTVSTRIHADFSEISLIYSDNNVQFTFSVSQDYEEKLQKLQKIKNLLAPLSFKEKEVLSTSLRKEGF